MVTVKQAGGGAGSGGTGTITTLTRPRAARVAATRRSTVPELVSSFSRVGFFFSFGLAVEIQG